jgi:hypothetical protein
VNVAEAESPVVPVTVRVYGPGVAAAATVNPLPVTWPEELIVQVVAEVIAGVVGACEKVHAPASPELKLLPVTAMVVPMGPELGVRRMNGTLTVTVKPALAKSVVVPVTMIVYVPGVAVVATVNPLADS